MSKMERLEEIEKRVDILAAMLENDRNDRVAYEEMEKLLQEHSALVHTIIYRS